LLSRNVDASRRRAVTLVEVVVSIAILAVFATVVIVHVGASGRTGDDAKRVEDAAKMLERLRDAAVRYNFGDPSLTGLNTRNVNGDTSFTAKISGIGALRGGVNPSRLSMLTNKITTSNVNSCGGAFNSSQANGWQQNFFSEPIPINGTFKLADGFIANDALERYNPAGVLTNLSPTTSVTGAGTLAIVIPNVALADARALAMLMEGDQPSPLGSGNFAVLRFTPSGNAPVTVRYHMAIHGC
jgi:prepilin-type N-terminal cleavage/methylation domain-containing protein